MQLYQYESTLYYAEETASKYIDLIASRLILKNAAKLGIKRRQSSSLIKKYRDNTIAKTIVFLLQFQMKTFKRFCIIFKNTRYNFQRCFAKNFKNINFCKLIVFVCSEFSSSEKKNWLMLSASY